MIQFMMREIVHINGCVFRKTDKYAEKTVEKSCNTHI